ncbi:hypothetical protein PGSY75_1354700 [Plasmodium gaboni]|uniref:Uncharacterized protein n=1 Tax=Plasmodium gaboni TaxID=647221 RepID=A0A151LEB9_9APIC|nr:hypothetical protein PGSY75_1354700 [Plasmodium gaboni]KYN97315.1 hypothetical protein PGSY75_1354700 [Plasmodium gaboni]
MPCEEKEMLVLHFTIHDVYDNIENKISLEEKPYIKFYWKNKKYKNYLKYSRDEINWFSEFFLPYKLGDYIENLIVQIWANSYILKTKKKVAYNYININDVERKRKINGKTELIGKRKGLKIIYSLQLIRYSLYEFMKNTQMLILDKISIYKMIQIHRKNQNISVHRYHNNNHLFDKYIISLFEKENYIKKNTALKLKTIKEHNKKKKNSTIKSNVKTDHIPIEANNENEEKKKIIISDQINYRKKKKKTNIKNNPQYNSNNISVLDPKKKSKSQKLNKILNISNQTKQNATDNKKSSTNNIHNKKKKKMTTNNLPQKNTSKTKVLSKHKETIQKKEPNIFNIQKQNSFLDLGYKIHKSSNKRNFKILNYKMAQSNYQDNEKFNNKISHEKGLNKIKNTDTKIYVY